LALNPLFPAFGIDRLRRQHGQRWSELVDTLCDLPLSDTRVMAFTSLMRRLRRSHSPEHSLCDDPLCALCASQIVANYDAGEDELLNLYHENLHAIEHRIKTRTLRHSLIARRAGAVA
jgi:hypothetical protein